ncbi:MAG TPA: phage major capsid protein [Candidatus Saccharimonadales bacterium]|nr:phage major capsid protein [Candidatus Saccharimonadales bacterium]
MVLATVINATLQKSRRKLILASMRSNALMAWAFANDRVEYEDGGYQITNPLTVGRNPNVASYEYYDQLPVAQTNEFTTVTYYWSRVAGSVIISDQEEDENRGESAIFKLMKAKMDVLEESIKEQFSSYLYAAGGGTDPLGLASLIPDDPTTGTLGGINRATETQWRTSSYAFAGALNATNIEEAFDDILLDLTLKSDKPDLILVGRNIYRLYRAAVRDKITFALSDTSNGKRMMDLGFTGISHQNIPILYDEDCPVNKAYFINSKYLRTHILRHVNMKVKSLTAPWDTDAEGSRIVWQGQFALWRAYRTHGVLNN